MQKGDMAGKNNILRKLRVSSIIFGAIASICLCTFNLSPASATNSTTSSINVDLINGVAIRILDKTASSEITNLPMELLASPGGSFVSDNFIVEVDTSNRTGYKLYMASDYEHTTAMVNLDNPEFTIPSLTSDVSKSDFATGSTAGTSDKAYVNHWGYSLDDTTYHAIPEPSTTNLINTTSTAIAHDRLPIFIAADVDLSKASGQYRNSLVFSAIANPVPTAYTLSFNLNGGSAPSTDPNAFNDMTASEVAAQHTFTIPTTLPELSGYALTGWLDQAVQAQIDAGTLDPDTKGGLNNLYQPGDSITIVGNEDYVGSATLTAQWEEAGCEGGANRICFVANEPSGTVEGEMEDQTIVYLTSASNSLNSTALSSSTSELTLYSPNWTLAGYGFKGWNTKADGTGTMYGPNQTISVADGTLTSDMQTAIGSTGLMLYAQWVASAGNMASWSGCSSMNQGDVTALTYGSDTYAVAKLTDKHCWMIENLRYQGGGTSSNSWGTGYTTKQYNYTNLTGSTNSPTDNGTTNKWLSYGSYYSWASAINATSDYSTQYGNPSSTTGSTQGICPSSWRLPRSYYSSTASNINAEFSYLHYTLTGAYTGGSSAINSNKWRTYPNNFVFAGTWNSSSSDRRGTYGRYWSSTVNNSYNAYYLGFYPTGVGPQGYNYKYYGSSVRCVIGS